MSLKTILTALMLIIGVFLFWGGLDSVLYIMKLGSPLSDALMEPPTSLIRLLAAGAIILGAGASLLNWRRGGWVIGLGIFLWCLLAGLMALSGADFDMWKDEALFSGILLVLAGAMIGTRGK